jgi:hypothetical protein
VGDGDHVRSRGQGHRAALRGELRQGRHPVGGRDPVVVAPHNEHRAGHRRQRAVDTVSPGHVHGATHVEEPGLAVVAGQDGDLSGALPDGGAEPAHRQRRPVGGSRIGRRADQHQSDDPGRILDGGFDDDLTARGVTEQHHLCPVKGGELPEQASGEPGRVSRRARLAGHAISRQRDDGGPDDRLQQPQSARRDLHRESQPRNRNNRGPGGMRGPG